MFEIKKTKIEDIEGLHPIYQWYVDHSTATFDMGEVTKEQFIKILGMGEKGFFCYSLLENEHIIGYALIFPFSQRKAYDVTAEVSIYLLSTHTKKGYGKNALEYLLKIAKNNQYHSLIAKICTENQNSMDLFENNGFIKIGELKKVGIKFDRFLDVAIYQRTL